MKTITRIVIGALTLVGAASAAFAGEATGTWVRPSTGTIIKTYTCGDKLCAKITGVKDKAKQGTVGTVIVSGAIKTGTDSWKGDLLNTEDGQTYNGVITLVGGGLTLKGCVLGGIICKGETWARVN